MPGRTILIIGGADSGKSRFALARADKKKGTKYYLATADPMDEEMRVKIRAHRLSRSDAWRTIRVGKDLPSVIRKVCRLDRVVLVDGIGLWVARFMTARDRFRPPIESLLDSVHSAKGHVTLVSEEVGLGIVPSHRSARNFRRTMGDLNQKLAEIAHESYLIVAGRPIRL